jgi:hypothetical protein
MLPIPFSGGTEFAVSRSNRRISFFIISALWL